MLGPDTTDDFYNSSAPGRAPRTLLKTPFPDDEGSACAPERSVAWFSGLPAAAEGEEDVDFGIGDRSIGSGERRLGGGERRLGIEHVENAGAAEAKQRTRLIGGFLRAVARLFQRMVVVDLADVSVERGLRLLERGENGAVEPGFRRVRGGSRLGHSRMR